MNNNLQPTKRMAPRPTHTVSIGDEKTPSGQSQQAQSNAFRSALIMLGAALASVPLYIYLAGKINAWQLAALVCLGILVAIASIFSAIAARRGQVTLSIGILIGTICLLVPVISTVVAGVGLFLGISNTLAGLVIASQTLRGSSAIRASIAGVLSGVVTLLIDLFWTSNRLVIPELQLFVPVLAVIAISVLCLTIVRKFPSYSLRVKLVVVLVGVAILSIGAVAFTVNRVASAQIRHEIGTNLAALTRGKAFEIGALLVRHKNTIESLALNEALQTEVRAANANSTSDPAYLARLDEQWKTAKDNTDPLIRSTLYNQVAEELREYQRRFPEYVEIFLTNKYGGNIASTNRTSDYYQADESWWQVTWNRGMGGVYISQPQLDESTGVYAIDIASPVYYENTSEILGILRATVDVTSLKDILLAGEFGQTGSVDLVFPDQQILHGDQDTLVQGLDPESANLIASLQESFGSLNYEGTRKLVSKGLVSSINATEKDKIERLGWYVVTNQDQSEALQSIASTTRTIVLVALVILILTGALALYVGHLLTTPLSRLTATAAQVSEGNLTVQALVTSQDEIGILAATFNSMTNQLRGLLGSMEQRVAERTRDLELASEVGRTISERVADLQDLLSEAVELIRERFNLYYTQIYLVEHDGRILKLRAGTGEVGRMLLQRGHHLLIGSGSLNGRAAADKQTIIVADTAQSANFLPNPLLPHTRSEMAVPLIAGKRVVGVLNMQSEHPGSLREADLAAFEALAGQLAIAIQNATLFAEAQQSKMEVEAQARRLTKLGWQEFLDAVERSEQLEYAFGQSHIASEKPVPHAESDRMLMIPLVIMGEEIGAIQLVNESDQAWSREQVEIAGSTATMLTNQIENLRLLAQAERYRAEAEQIAHRLTREGWDSYLKTRQNFAEGYVYDSNSVRALSRNGHKSHGSSFSRSVVVREEVIGELAVDYANGTSEEAEQMIEAVATRLGEHLDNLRLLEQSQQRSFELEEAQTFLDSVIESLPNMLFVKDAEELRFLRWNRTAEELVGFAQEAMLGKNDYDFFPPDEADFFTSKDREVLATGKTLDIPEEPLATAHRGTRYMHTRKTPVYGADGKAKYLLGVAEDITERKLATETLARRATELATVAAVSTTASTVLDPDELLQSVVDLAKERFGLYHAHIYLADDTWQTLLLAAGAGQVGRKMVAEGWSIPFDHETSLVATAARARKQVIANDVYRDKASGFLSHQLLPDTRSEMAVPMIVGDRLLGVFDVQSDLVGRFTEEDANIYTTLAAQVGVALQNARLYVQQTATVTQLRELDRLKSSFLANMSHELRTPLNSILGFADVMLEGLDGELTDYMDNDLRLIRKNGQHLLHLINDVLDMAKIESGRMNLNPETFRVHDVLEEIVSITSTLASEKNLSLFIGENSDHDIKVYADNTRLRQVMLNLVNNAIKFTERGKIILSAKAIEGARVLIAVKDTGIGIPPDKLEAIFQEFTQVDSSTTRKAGGTGLGLPISRRLVELHGGRLWAESAGNPGEGSVFFVELPLEARLVESVER